MHRAEFDMAPIFFGAQKYLILATDGTLARI